MKRLRPAVRLALINLAMIVVGLVLIGGTLEAYCRLTEPFEVQDYPARFDPAVGFTFQPNTRVRWTNDLDYWTETNSNVQGFLDRPPLSPEQAATDCHIAFIGDSFVEALQVPIADKLHVQLEQMANKQIPDWRISTSAYGISGTGQLNQLPFYDVYARKVHPRLVVLVFVSNDFTDNSAALAALSNGWDPDHLPRPFALEAADGSIEIQPIDPDWRRYLLPTEEPARPGFWARQWARVVRRSYFATWVQAQLALRASPSTQNTTMQRRSEILSRRPRYSDIADGWQPETQDMAGMFTQSDLPPVFKKALQFTGFALDEFKRRTDNDHASLLILASHSMHAAGDRPFLYLKQLADERGIPLVDQWEYAQKKGGDLRSLNFAHDGHWTVTGHRWAAEAVLDWLKDHPSVCRKQVP